MKGDFSRHTFAAENRYDGVLMQQGRVQMDADWNEQVAIARYRTETQTIDVVGPTGAPTMAPGFEVSIDPQLGLLIGGGRYYVDGLLCEAAGSTAYTLQPDLPTPPDVLAALGQAQAAGGLVYLHVWQRHITAVEDPLLADVALGGADTTTRLKTIWQVKVLPLPSLSVTAPDQLRAQLQQRLQALSALITAINNRDDAGIAAQRAALVGIGRQIGALVPNLRSTFQEWQDLTGAHVGKLVARARQPDPSATAADPCVISPDASYRGVENQLYRVEIHSGGPTGQATFKWSRDNGSVVAAIVGLLGAQATIAGLPRDDIEALAAGQWVEVLDDVHELNQQAGDLVQIAAVDPTNQTITLSRSPSAIDLSQNPKLRRWDSAGALPVQVTVANDGWIALEDGVEVLFQVDGVYRTGDYWMIPARTATGDVEWPPLPDGSTGPLPPLGVRQHFAPLALVAQTSGTLSVLDDRRHLFAPASEVVSLVYVGGDGQSGLPNTVLGRSLDVAVVNGTRPWPGRRVRFTTNRGTIQVDAQTGRSLVAITGLDGIASCAWQLDDGQNGSAAASFVEAVLLDAANLPCSQPVRFSATVSLASAVSYAPPSDLSELATTDTVQEAIDQLGRLRHGAGDPGLHVLRTLLIQTNQVLSNDIEVAAAVLQDGIRVVCDAPIDPVSVKPPTCYVTLYVPQVVDQNAGGTSPSHDLVGQQQLIIAADVSGSQATIQWKPRAEAVRWFQQTLPPLFAVGDGRILAWLTLRGHYIWGATRGADNGLVYLDGDAFGLPRGQNGTDINLPSGDGRRGGDFGMWFWLVQVVRLTTFTLNNNVNSVVGGVTVQATVTLSGLAPAGGVTINVSSNNAAATVPPTVVVPAGSSTATFQITTRAVAADTPCTISAVLGTQPPQTQALLVRAPVPSQVSLSPTEVVGGSNSAASITLTGPAPDGGLVVSLSADPAGAVTFPNNANNQVTVPAAASSVSGVTVATRGVIARTTVTVRANVGATAQTAPLSVTPTVTLSQVTLNRPAVVVGDQVTGTVTLTGNAPVAATVALSSSDPTIVSPPQTVVVAAGQSSVQFTLDTLRVGAITLTAALSGVTRPATLSIQAPAVLTSVAINPSTVPVGDPVAGTVTLSGAPLTNTVVGLTSSNPAVASVPSSVTVPSGQTSAAFQGQAVAVGAPVTVTGSLGSVTQTATVTVAPPSVSTLTFNPPSVRGSASVTGTVTLSRAAPAGGSVVGLASGNTAVGVPASVTVPAGQTSATFTATTQPVGSSVVVTVTASIGGLSRPGSLTVIPADLTSVVINPPSVTSGNGATGTATLNGPAPAGGIVVALASSNSSLVGVPTSVTVGANASSATFGVTTTPIVTSASVTITGTLRGVSASGPLNLGPKPKDTKETKDTKDTKDKEKEKDRDGGKAVQEKVFLEKVPDVRLSGGETLTEEPEAAPGTAQATPFIETSERPAVGDQAIAQPIEERKE